MSTLKKKAEIYFENSADQSLDEKMENGFVLEEKIPYLNQHKIILTRQKKDEEVINTFRIITKEEKLNDGSLKLDTIALT